MSIFSDSDSESTSEQCALPAALSWRIKPTDERRLCPTIWGTASDAQKPRIVHQTPRSTKSVHNEVVFLVEPSNHNPIPFPGTTDAIQSEDSSLVTLSTSYDTSRGSSSFSNPINFLNRLTISRDQTRRKDYRREQLAALKTTEDTNLDSTEAFLTYEERVENFKQGLAALETEYCELFAYRIEPQPFDFKPGNKSTYPSNDYSVPTSSKSAYLSDDSMPVEDTVPMPASPSRGNGEARIHSSTSEYNVPLPPDIDAAHSSRYPEESQSSCDGHSPRDALSPRPQSPDEDPVPVKHPALLGSKPEKQDDRITREGLTAEISPSSWIVLYNIREKFHVSQPEWVKTPKGYSPSRSTLLKDLDSFLDKNHDVMFILHKCYSTVSSAMQGIPLDEKALSHRADSMYITLTQPMIEAMESMLEHVPSFDSMFPNLYLDNAIPYPYLPLYFLYPSLDEVIAKLDPVFAERIEPLRAFLEEYQVLEYRHAREIISRGCIDRSTIAYLVHPGQVLVERRGQDTVAFMATSWAIYNAELDSGPVRNARPGTQHVSDEARYRDLWQVRGWSWKFNGTFEKKSTTIDVFVPVTDSEVRIADLNVHPIEFADNDIRDLLERRGKIFWKCRLRKFVSYTADEDDGFAGTSDRYMVDYRTYQRLHPESKTRAGRDDIGKAAMLDDDPPQDDTIFLFPTKLIGFNLRLKKWMQLLVDRISEPQWNKKAFESLVVESDTKLLLKALVTEQIAADKSTDIISGKGNGLLILLHGGPGTGKTFTAESVAEMTEKPLYRVTCGDIGTKPDEVEKYLESVLHLGKIWGCVVLMDEADVFLEERSLTDLQRNALVSVFLRVLEYYDGILILTSNRVGTFDQAFKSRIQLALHYTNLNKPQRRKIWRNFITRLKELGETNIDYDDIYDNMDELCAEEMNGRQIRNAITTARQLAQFQKETFAYDHLKHVIAVSNRFETYLNSVNHGYTDDQLAQDAGLRFHKAY